MESNEKKNISLHSQILNLVTNGPDENVQLRQVISELTDIFEEGCSLEEVPHFMEEPNLEILALRMLLARREREYKLLERVKRNLETELDKTKEAMCRLEMIYCRK